MNADTENTVMDSVEGSPIAALETSPEPDAKIKSVEAEVEGKYELSNIPDLREMILQRGEIVALVNQFGQKSELRRIFDRLWEKGKDVTFVVVIVGLIVQLCSDVPSSVGVGELALTGIFSGSWVKKAGDFLSNLWKSREVEEVESEPEEISEAEIQTMIEEADNLAAQENDPDKGLQAVAIYEQVLAQLTPPSFFEEYTPGGGRYDSILRKIQKVAGRDMYSTGENMAILDLLEQKANEGKIVYVGGGNYHSSEEHLIANIFEYPQLSGAKIFTHLALDINRAELSFVQRFVDKMNEAIAENVVSPGVDSIVEHPFFADMQKELKKQERFSKCTSTGLYAFLSLVQKAQNVGLKIEALGIKDAELFNNLADLDKEPGRRILVHALNTRLIYLAQSNLTIKTRIYPIIGFSAMDYSQNQTKVAKNEFGFLNRYFGRARDGEVGYPDLPNTLLGKLSLRTIYPDAPAGMKIGDIANGIIIVSSKSTASRIQRELGAWRLHLEELE